MFELDAFASGDWTVRWIRDIALPCRPSPENSARRAKARSFSGCEPHPATVAPAGSNRSSRGGNEAAEAFGVEGPARDLASMQAVT